MSRRFACQGLDRCSVRSAAGDYPKVVSAPPACPRNRKTLRRRFVRHFCGLDASSK